MPQAPFKAAHLSDIPAVAPAEPGSYEWRPVRHHLGITTFGVNVWVGANAGDIVIEEHQETPEEEGVSQSQEELYFVVAGHATFTVSGEELDAPAGTFVFVAEPGAIRSAVAKEPGTTVLAVGVPVGDVFEVSAWERRRLE
jgi:quercetin dioxygenase-like cupin family protein